MRFVSGEGFVVDDVYLTELWPKVHQDGPGSVVISWQILIKPLAVDDVTSFTIPEGDLPRVLGVAIARVHATPVARPVPDDHAPQQGERPEVAR